MKFTIAQDIRIGARPYQQDRVGHWSTSESLMLVIADGMGGHQHGEIAAQTALEYFAGEFKREAKPKIKDPDLFLFRGLARAHSAILQQARRFGWSEAPRTVIVVCVVQDGRAYWTHIGDSRLYLIRAGRVVTRTKDHSRVQQLVDEGRIREEAIPSHPERNLLFQCLGGDKPPKLEPAAGARLAKNDLLLMCSDGLWGPLSPHQLLNMLLTKPPARAVPDLAALAETRAGADCDNISLLLMQWGEEAATAAKEQNTIPFHDLPASQQAADTPDLDYMNMTDADIERSIAQIKAALRKQTGNP
ncbi:MAG: serine/threonine-protein phosphatase [Betaproteobacteria bacterium]|nr:serine/threonine-protein phosphatase [Betaproteobacteria bacterium]